MVVVTVGLLWSCGKKIPEGVIRQDKMTQVLIDLHIAESKVNSLSLNADSTGCLIDILTQRVLEEHELDHETYLRSYNFYMNDIRMMESVYGRVVDSLSLRYELLNNELSQ